jgi:L-ascorbate metabolism protein UlaG (beta-lactamase superfamily)
MKTLSIIGLVFAVLVLAIAITTYFVLRLPQFGKAPAGEKLEKMAASSQYNQSKKTFENLGQVEMQMGVGDMIKLLPAFFTPSKNKRPESIEVLHPDIKNMGKLNEDEVAFTWFGHSAFLLEIGDKILLLDPMLGPAAAPFSFQVKRFTQELPITPENLPEIDAVIFSHDHYDHLDYPTIQAIKDKVGHFYVPLGLGSHLMHWGVAENKITELDWWQAAVVEGITLTCTPAQHFSGRGLTDRGKTLWSSWVINTGKKRIFFNGDSGYFSGFKEIGERFGPFDLAFVECGQYNELWQEIHMLPEESAQAGVDLKTKYMMPIHWGMFDLALHTWTEPIERVKAKAQDLNLPLITPKIGERMLVSDTIHTEQWW